MKKKRKSILRKWGEEERKGGDRRVRKWRNKEMKEEN